MGSSDQRKEGSEEESYPTICPRCYARGELRVSERPGILQVHLRSDGTIDKDEARKEAVELRLVCPECGREYWMNIEFVAGKAPGITVHTSPQMSLSENAKVVEPVEVFYSREKRWWFYRKGEKDVEIGPGEPSS